ncbi:hypothetical protein BJ170DRAFT_385887 [Xylariales sp. AK1849]|nr:hypothetical protein BJ170DRAFT_385887 [Xylariales sp. AK1849]
MDPHRMKPSLDPAYIARRIMASRNSITTVPVSAVPPAPLPALSTVPPSQSENPVPIVPDSQALSSGVLRREMGGVESGSDNTFQPRPPPPHPLPQYHILTNSRAPRNLLPEIQLPIPTEVPRAPDVGQGQYAALASTAPHQASGGMPQPAVPPPNNQVYRAAEMAQVRHVSPLTRTTRPLPETVRAPDYVMPPPSGSYHQGSRGSQEQVVPVYTDGGAQVQHGQMPSVPPFSSQAHHQAPQGVHGLSLSPSSGTFGRATIDTQYYQSSNSKWPQQTLDITQSPLPPPYSEALSGSDMIQIRSEAPIAGIYQPKAVDSHGKESPSRNEGQQPNEDPDDDVDMVGEIAYDPLLNMQNNLTTFEDSVRSFVGAGNEKNVLSEYRDQTTRRRPFVKRGPRKAAEPTGDVKLRLNNASSAFLSGKLDEALDYVNDAIRINSEIHRAWTLLAEIMREREDYKQSLLAMVCAAHLQPKIFDAWFQCARFALELLEAFPDDAEDTLKIAIFTLSQAVRIQPDNVGVRQTRAALYLTRQSYKQAAGEYKFLVDRSPYDIAALNGLVDASVQFAESSKKAAEGQREEARDAYRRCIEHFQAEYAVGAADPGLPFSWDDAFIYIALLSHLEQYDEALKEIRSLSRWLLGRREEEYWDEQGDDREWDKSDKRRKEIPEFDSAKHPLSSYGSGLPLRLRIGLATCRLRMDQVNDEEAMQHLEWLDPLDISESEDDSQHSELFLDVATTLYETGRLAAALPFFEPLRRQSEFLEATSLYQVGKCYLEIGDKRQAEQCFAAVLDSEDAAVETRIEARYELAKMYEAARKNAEAYLLVNEALELENDRDESSTESDDEQEVGDDGELRPKAKRKPTAKKRTARVEKMPKEKKPRAPRKPSGERKPRVHRPRPLVFALDEDRRLEEERRSAYLVDKWRIVHDEREESDQGPGDLWMEAARELVDDFRSFKAFYPWERYLTHMGLKKDESSPSSSNPLLLKMAQRLRDELDAPQLTNASRVRETTVGYRDVAFPEWLDLFLELALSLAHSGKIKESYGVCESAMAANVFFENPEDKFIINVAMGACAVRGRDEERCVEIARTIMANYQFSSDGFRMYAALSRLCHSTATWYADSRVQKFTLRQIKFMDSALVPADKRTKGLEALDPKTYPGKVPDVQLLMLYGHILFISNSFTFALNYFVRAYAMDPDNLMVNISIGQAYLHYALKRQSENRQHSIAQGFAFLHRYYDMKLAAAMTSAQRQEAHYNLARSYHAVGLSHLATEYYRRVFQENEGDQVGDEDLAREAAYNLQMCCLVGGDVEAVKDIAERWLVM